MELLFLALAGCSWFSSEPATVPAPPPTQNSANAARSYTGPTGTPDWVVDCNGGGDFTTINAAIAAARPNQWISVEPCVYHERIDYRGKSLWISSTGGAAVTEIDADNNNTTVRATQGEGDNTALVGFTISDGDPYGVAVEFAALRLQDVILTNNHDNYTIRAEAADLEMVNVVIDATNSSSRQAIYMDKGSVTMTGSTIHCGNGGGLQLDHGSFHIDWSSVLCGNAGFGETAFQNEHSVGRVRRSVIVGDQEHISEDDHPEDEIRFANTLVQGDILVNFGTFQFRNSVMVDGTVTLTDTADDVDIDSSVFMDGPCAFDGNILPVSQYTNYWNTPFHCTEPSVVGDDGNISIPPAFDMVAGDFTLLWGSGLIDAGNPAGSREDLDGSRNDIGLYGGRFTNAGGW